MTDEEALAAHGVDREALMVRVVQVYAQQLFVDGFFNADPHAGNLMVQVRGGVAEPVLLDFGMTVRLSERQRLGYARLALSAQQMDLCGIIAAVGSLGVKTNQTGSDPARDLEFWRFFLRDTGTRDEARKQSVRLLQDARGAARAGQARGARRAAARRDPARPHLLLAGDRAAPRAVHLAPRPRAVHGAARGAREARARVAHAAAAPRARARAARRPAAPRAAAPREARLAPRRPRLRGRRRRRRPGVRPARRHHARRGGGGLPRPGRRAAGRGVDADALARAVGPPPRARGARARQARRPQADQTIASLCPRLGRTARRG